MEPSPQEKLALVKGELTRRLDQYDKDKPALDNIAEMLRDPDWGVGMLEDIADLVRATGRTIETSFTADGEEISTWGRH